MSSHCWLTGTVYNESVETWHRSFGISAHRVLQCYTIQKGTNSVKKPLRTLGHLTM